MLFQFYIRKGKNMPGLITHYLLGEKVLEKLKDTGSAREISKYRNIYNVGAEGPDIFFYYIKLPLSVIKGMSKIGSRLHAENVGEFFSNAIEYLLNCSGEEKAKLTAYLSGFLCHYSMDLHTHPYVYYRTGFVRDGEKPTIKYTSYHQEFETAIDVCLLDSLMSIKPTALGVHRLLKLSDGDAQIIGRFYEFILGKIYNVQISADKVSSVIRGMMLVQYTFRDRYGYKKRIVSSLEKCIVKYPIISSLIYPPRVEDGIDYMNNSHKPWHAPWDMSKTFTLSFIEMFHQAENEAICMCRTLMDCLSGTASTAETLKLIGGRSFSTGEDCHEEREFKYYDCVFESNNTGLSDAE